MKVFKRVLLGLAIVLGVILLAAVGLFTFLTVTEFRPEPVEALEISENPQNEAPLPSARPRFTVLSWNIGYCGLGQESDFFMDGGTQVHPLNEELVEKNYLGVLRTLQDRDPDVILLQEVDSSSTRSGMDEVRSLAESLAGRSSAYALNFSAKFVPYPLPPIGRVNSGLQTLSRFTLREASRISLPCPFSWPVSMVNLKRCLLVSRVPLADSDKELVLVNLHLEAYDDGEGKLAQSRQLRDFVEQEYQKGNYVIAGGDWNQIFPDTETAFPNTHKELWTPGYLDEGELAEGWRYVWDDAVPSCRLLNQPYDPADAQGTQYYVIDGFMVSPNLRVESVETLDEGFACSDHNPVLLTVSLED